MLKNVFKGKKKDKTTKKRMNKSNSMDNSNSRKKGKTKQKSKTKSKRSQTNPTKLNDIETVSRSKKKKRKKQNKSDGMSIYQLSDYVSLKGKRKGIIRYIGDVHFANGQWFGIELIDGTVGNHDGKVGNQRYFKTASQSAIFVTYNQIKKVIKKGKFITIPSVRDSAKSRSNSRKKKKKEKPSNSLKNRHPRKHSPHTARVKPNRPNSAKRFDEFFSDHKRQHQKLDTIHHKRCVPPPPVPRKQKHFDSHHQPPPQHARYMDRNSYSHSTSSQPHIVDHYSIDSTSSKLELPLQISTYSLQHTATNDSNISNELSAGNDDNDDDTLSPVSIQLKKAQKDALVARRSYNVESNIKIEQKEIRKHKSQGDEYISTHNQHGLSLDNFYTHYDLSDPAIQKLRHLQKSIRRTQNKSDDLEQLLSATPPSLPPTPNDLKILPVPVNESKASRFMFNRERSNSDSIFSPNHRKDVKRKYRKRQIVKDKELQSESEDTDVEDMYIKQPVPQTSMPSVFGEQDNDDIVTRGSGRATINGIEQNTIILESIPSPTHAKQHHIRINHDNQLNGANNGEVAAYLQENFPIDNKLRKNGYKGKKKDKIPEIGDRMISNESALSDMIVTPRSVGTDAFSRIRSRSIQNKLAQKKAMKYPVHSDNGGPAMTESIKTAKDVCPFWNPFALSPECPYLSITSSCTLKHLSKSAYLDRLSEDDTIELLTVLFVDSLFVESCVVIEKLLEINADNDEYNTCFGDILEELGRYQDAEKYYKIALALNPMYDDAHNNYAMMLHHKLDRLTEAEEEYKQCLSINKEHQVCHTNYAKLLQCTSRYREGEKHFKKCLKLNEENVNCQHYYGLFLYEMGRWNEARYHLQKAIELTNGNNASYHYNLAKLLCDLKELTEAHLHFKHCLRLEAENAAFNFEFALFLAFDLKDMKQSIQYFVKAYLLDPHNLLIQKKYDEIAKIVKETGLTKVRRRKSSARLQMGKKQKHKTVVEYDCECKNHEMDDINPCQSEFCRFLSDNFSFGNSMNVYLKRFKDADLNDIRYIVAIDYDILLKDILMKKIHAKIMMTKIEKFKTENYKFMEWFNAIHLQEYYEIFEQNGILTFESFYFHITSNADLIRILGDKNIYDVQIIWRKCPKYVRQNSMIIHSDENGNENDADYHDTGDFIQIEGT